MHYLRMAKRFHSMREAWGKKNLHRSNGVTLMEMLVAVGIVTILASIAISYGGNTIYRQRLLSTTREMYAMLYTARVAALSENRFGVVQFRTDTRDAIAYVERSKPANWAYDIGTDKLLMRRDYDAGTVVNSLFNVAGGFPTAVFNSRGFSVDPGATTSFLSSSVEVTYPAMGDSTKRTVSVTAGGALRITDP